MVAVETTFGTVVVGVRGDCRRVDKKSFPQMSLKTQNKLNSTYGSK